MKKPIRKPKLSRQAANVVKRLKASLTRTQGAALVQPTQVGHNRRGVIVREARKGGRDRVLMLSVDMAGGPELLGPCWHATVRFGEQQLIVAAWTAEEIEESKRVVLRAIHGVGFGERLDVKVGETQLDVWKLCTNLEAAVAGHAAGKDGQEYSVTPKVEP